MSESTKALYNQKVEATAKELQEKGYDVIVEPSSDSIPFALGGYTPDLVAFRGNNGIILEVKESSARFSVDRFQELAERIAAHEGWRFLLVTLDDVTDSLFPNGDDGLPSWTTLQTKLASVETLIQNEMLEPALLYLWSCIEGLLRKQAMVQKLPIDRLPPVKLVNHMYSSGEISMDEFDVIRAALEKRNRVAHGLVTSLSTDDELEGLLTTTRLLIEKWQGTISSKMTP
ncbi:hypothetical protein QGP82_05355 [Leptothoe sp. LEGE 181152]|nr:hypothetical protein [Leptothoe sp. LEGE 181152]